MHLNILTLVLGFGFSAAGLFAFILPATFFGLLGDYYGEFNYHFVKDAGIAFFSSGLLILLSQWVAMWRLPLLFGGALFVTLHGVFHIQMLFMGMAPTFLDIVVEIFVIIGPAVLTAALLVLRVRQYAQMERAKKLQP